MWVVLPGRLAICRRLQVSWFLKSRVAAGRVLGRVGMVVLLVSGVFAPGGGLWWGRRRRLR